VFSSCLFLPYFSHLLPFHLNTTVSVSLRCPADDFPVSHIHPQGRIGRIVFRNALIVGDIDVVAINECVSTRPDVPDP